MAQKGKRISKARETVDPHTQYSIEEAVKLVKKNATSKFDETIEIAINLGVDPKHADQVVRGVCDLPNGSGRNVRVAVFARDDKADEAKKAGADLVGAEELAEKTNYHPRWLLEWLKNQAAARILEYHEKDRFELTEVGSAVMANESDSLYFSAGAFNKPMRPEIIDKIADAFTTGVGFSYEEQGPTCAHGTERMLAPWTKLALIPKIIPQFEGLKEKLESHAVVADVGCGGGIAITTLAEIGRASCRERV